MPKHYVTFGQIHVHSIEGKIFHHNTIARFDAKDAEEGRQKAFEFFGPKFAFDYHDKEIEDISMEFYDGFTDL